MRLVDGLTSPAKERYAVSQNNVTKLVQPGSFSDPLTEVLRDGARRLLAPAVEAEVAAFIAKHADLSFGQMAISALCAMVICPNERL